MQSYMGKYSYYLLLLFLLFIFNNCNKKDENCLLVVEIQANFIDSNHIQLTALTSGHIGEFEILWDGFHEFEAFPVSRGWGTYGIGTHTVMVKDALGCVAHDTIVVNFCPKYMDDGDGQRYEVIGIGSQCWTKSNLKLKADIPEVRDSSIWSGTNAAAWCYFGNATVENENGKLYNWPAVTSGKLCPKGWHIPSKVEWDTLTNYLGGALVAGGKMKATSNEWQSPNTGATNSSGFNALPSGYRSANNLFWDLHLTNGIWSSTEFTDNLEAWYLTLNTNSTGAFIGHSNKKSGYSCRCVQN